jgi:hypothetical protein
VTGEKADILGEMVQEATALIAALQAEGSGRRDGDGNWYGCFPVAELVFNLEGLLAEYEDRNPEGAAARARRKTARYGLELPPICSERPGRPKNSESGSELTLRRLEDCRDTPEPAR